MGTRKVTISSLAGAITVILMFVIESMTGTEVPGSVSSAITTVVMAVLFYYVEEVKG